MNKYKSLLKRLQRFLFPLNYTCNACGCENFNGKYFCDDCLKQLPFNKGTVCNHCGRYVFNSEERCFSCRDRETYFQKARSAFVYAPPIDHLITQLKYNGKKYIAQILAEYMSPVYFAAFFNSQVMVYTPMSGKRLKQRGYNQAKLIADELSPLISVPVLDDVLVKNKETERQVTLSAVERKKNLSGSFAVNNKEAIKGKSVLIIDDVMTTGATVEILSQLLLKSGAETVNVLTAASVSKGEEGKHIPNKADKVSN